MAKRSVPLHRLTETPISTRRRDELDAQMRARRAAEMRCCWPKCPKDRYEPGELCAAHLEVANTIYQAMINPTAPQPVTKVTAVITDEPVAAPSPTPQPVGTVYYLRSGGYIKIGWASDLSKRMRAYPPDSTLLAHHPGTKADETMMHRRFAACRSHGREWFAMVPALTDHIARVQAEHGQPEQVDFGARPVTVPQPRPKAYVGGNYRGNGLIGQQRM